MQIFKHVTANLLKLEPFDFVRELSMEDYLIENQSILALDDDNFSNPKVIYDELPVLDGCSTKKTDGRIDLLVHYEGIDTLSVIELKKGEIDKKNIEQLTDYLKQNSEILKDLKDELKNENLDLKKLKWIGILVGTSISLELVNYINNGGRLHLSDKISIPLAALTVKRYKSEDGQYFVITDTYFNKIKSAKDYSTYIFNGNEYGKARLVLAVVKDYVKSHPNISFEKLKEVFPDNLQGGYGVIRSKSLALLENKKESTNRYFTKEDEIILIADGEIAVSNQWGTKNIEKFLKASKNLDIPIVLSSNK